MIAVLDISEQMIVDFDNDSTHDFGQPARDSSKTSTETDNEIIPVKDRSEDRKGELGWRTIETKFRR